MVAPLSDVPQEGSSVFSMFSLIKLRLASFPLASSYSRVAVSSVFWAQNIYFSAQTRGGPVKRSPLRDGGTLKAEAARGRNRLQVTVSSVVTLVAESGVEGNQSPHKYICTNSAEV